MTSEENQAEKAQIDTDASLAAACAIAARRTLPGEELGKKIIGAQKDLNSKGKGEHWYRMVYRGGGWRYVSDSMLPAGAYLAADRRAKVYGEVYPGEIVVGHDRGEPIDVAYLVVDRGAAKWLREIEFSRLRSGRLRFALPDGSAVDLPDPRR